MGVELKKQMQEQRTRIQELDLPPTESEALAREAQDEGLTLLGLPAVSLSGSISKRTFPELVNQWDLLAIRKGKKSWGELVEAFGRKGYTPAEIAGSLGVSKERLVELMNEHEGVYEIIKQAHTLAEGYYTKMARKNMITPRGITFNTKCWSLIMQATYGWRTREDVAINTGVQGGGVVYLPPFEDEE